jgi:uncharacterized protein
MQKRVFIIHGWGGKPKGEFRPWLRSELEKRGYIVEVPEMPNTDNPKIEEWIGHMQAVIKNPDENTVIVGHSLGGQAVLRYLSELPEEIQIKKAILVAPVVEEITNRDFDEEDSGALWLKTPFDMERAKKAAKEIVGFFSDDDKWIPLSSEKILREKFGARTIVEHNMGHYNIKEAPQILEEIIS